MAHCFDVVGYVYDSAVYCTDCCENGNPIFADSEWETPPNCDECGEEIEVSVLPRPKDCIGDKWSIAINALEKKTLTVTNIEETDEGVLITFDNSNEYKFSQEDLHKNKGGWATKLGVRKLI